MHIGSKLVIVAILSSTSCSFAQDSKPPSPTVYTWQTGRNFKALDGTYVRDPDPQGNLTPMNRFDVGIINGWVNFPSDPHTWDPKHWVDDATIAVTLHNDPFVAGSGSGSDFRVSTLVQDGWIRQHTLDFIIRGIAIDPSRIMYTKASPDDLVDLDPPVFARDTQVVGGTGTPWPIRTTFYNPSDRLPGLSDDPNDNLHFYRFPTGALLVKDSNQSNRSFRHPFLLNATLASPLKAWTRQFAGVLKSHMSQLSGAPNPSWLANEVPHFYFDEEGYDIVADAGLNNSLFMLFYLAKASDATDAVNFSAEVRQIWTSWKVPGSPGWAPPADSELHDPNTTFGFRNTTGMTLQEMYDNERATRHPEWPIHIYDQTATGGPNGVLGINRTQRGDTPQNMPFMIWWQGICRRAEAAVWENAVYSEIHAIPGWEEARCSNYNMMRTDGVLDTVSWFKDTGQLTGDCMVQHADGTFGGSSGPTCDLNDVAGLANVLPRARYAVGNSHRMLWADPDTGARWTGEARWTESSVDSPEMYPYRADYDLVGVKDKGGVTFRGDRQSNLYTPAADRFPESFYDNSLATPYTGTLDHQWTDLRIYNNLRLFRATADAAINTPHPPITEDFVGQVTFENRLSPWFAEPDPALFGVHDVYEFYNSERGARAELSLLRGKRVQEILAWVSGNVEQDPIRNLNAWDATQSLVHRVWAPRIEYYQRISGIPHLEQHADPCNLAQLEDTVRRVNTYSDIAGDTADYTVDSYATTPIAETDPRRITRLEVGVNVPMGCFDDPSSPPCNIVLGGPADPDTNAFGDGIAHEFEINIECAADVAPPAGPVQVMLEAYNFSTHSWYALPPIDYHPADTTDLSFAYTLTLPDGSMRRTYILREPANHHDFVTLEPMDSTARGCSESSNYNMRLRLIEVTDGGDLSTRCDLVQVVPISPNAATEGEYPFVPHVVTGGENPTEAEDADSVETSFGVQVVGGDSMPIGDETPNDPPYCSYGNYGQYLFLNSAFSRIPPNCQGGGTGCYANAGIRIRFPYWVVMPDDINVPLMIQRYDEHAPAVSMSEYNYAESMDIKVRRRSDQFWSNEIIVRGNGTTLLLDGKYHISLAKNAAGVPFLVADNVNLWDAVPANDVSIDFTLVSDCNSNGIPDCQEIHDDPLLDVDWGPDGKIDDCQPRIICDPDMNRDGVLDQGDIDYLIGATAGDNPLGSNVDFNQDGVSDQGDVDALIGTIAGQGCPFQ